MTITVRALTPELANDWLAFFDGPAFEDNPDWKPCYCMFFHFEGTNDAWESFCEAGDSREAQVQRISLGHTRGYLAFDDAEPVGWVNAAPRSHYPKLDAFCPIDDAPTVGAVTCFVVASTHRRLGVARALLDAACDGFAAAGLSAAEAFPPKPSEALDNAAHNYRGPLALYESAGFSVLAEIRDTHLHVRRSL